MRGVGEPNVFAAEMYQGSGHAAGAPVNIAPGELRVLQVEGGPQRMSEAAGWQARPYRDAATLCSLARPLCMVCTDTVATVFCRNDRACLCDACDSAVHLSNPLSACHEILPLNRCLLEQVSLDGEVGGPGDESAIVLGPQYASATRVEGAAGQRFADRQRGMEQEVHGMRHLPVVELLPYECESAGPHVAGDRLEDFDIADECVKTGGGDRERSVVHRAEPVHQDGGIQLLQFPTAPFYSFYPPHHGASTSSVEMSLPMAGTIVPKETKVSLARKAKVARYLEKKKNRSYRNKIRYESRKAYAENRPRIKGRFARPDEFAAYTKEQKALEGEIS